MTNEKISSRDSGERTGLISTDDITDRRVKALFALSPPAIASLLDKCALAEKMVKSIKDHAKALLESDPAAIPGWRLKPGKVKTPINNAQTAYERASKHGVSLDTFMKCITVKKTELTEEVKKASKLKGKGLAKAMDELQTGITDTNQDAPSLAKEEAK